MLLNRIGLKILLIPHKFSAFGYLAKNKEKEAKTSIFFWLAIRKKDRKQKRIFELSETVVQGVNEDYGVMEEK